MKEKDILIQTIPLNVEAKYEAKSAPVEAEENQVYKYLKYSDSKSYYGHTNDRYPLTLLETIRSSNTATALYNTRSRFVAGSGASNEEMGEFIVNPSDGTTLNDLINILSKDYTKQKQGFIWIKSNQLDGIYSLDRIAPQNARLGLPNSANKVSRVHYSVHAFGSEDFNNGKKVPSKPFYDPLKRAPNQILYVNLDKEYNEYNPYPLSETQFQLFRTDAQLTSFNYNNLKNNFFGGAIINLVGNPNKQVPTGNKDDNGNDITESYGDVMARELGRNKVGSDNAGNLTILWTHGVQAGTP